LSSESAEVSSKTSGGIVQFVINIVIPDYEELPEAERLTIRSDFQFVIRKTAHFTIYSVLGVLAFLPDCLGTFVGAGFIYFSEKLIKSNGESGGVNKLLWAVTLHNLPEGLAVGFALGSGELGLASALSVSFGIGVQNFPEGLALSLSCFKNGKSKLKSFSYGVVSGVIEPIGAVIGALLVAYLSFLQPWVLAVAAGCMLFVIVEQLIPESVHSKGGVWGFVIGFCIMAALDLCL
jgi:ZIP family zinc transporter